MTSSLTHDETRPLSAKTNKSIVKLDYVLTPGGGNVMCVCLYQKSVCKVYRTEGVNCRYILCIRISVFAQSRSVHFFIVNCLLKNKFNIHVIYYLHI